MNQHAAVAYRIPALAQLLGCSELAARRMVERGVIPSRRLGRRVVVLASELEACLGSLPLRAPSSQYEQAVKTLPRC